VARDLLRSVDLAGHGVRLLGIRAEHLVVADERPPTLEEAVTGGAASARRADAALDEVRSRFGAAALRHGSLVHGPRIPETGPSSTVADASGDLS
jgi:DNA polymerase IV